MADLLPLALEVVITEWPINGPARVITHPWVKPFHVGRYMRCSHDYPLITDPSWCLRVDLVDLVPADPGWIAGSVALTDATGRPICRERPVRFYGRKSDTATHIYTPATAWDPAYSLALRVVGGGITDD